MCLSFLLYTSLLSVILIFSCFCTDLNNSVSLPEGSFVLAEELFLVTGETGLVIGEATHCFGGDGVVHTEVNVVSNTLSHGIDVISLWPTECTPVCSLKTPHRVSLASCDHLHTVLFVTGYLWTMGLKVEER